MSFNISKYQNKIKKLISVAIIKFHLQNIKITNGAINNTAPIIKRLNLLNIINKIVAVPKIINKLPKKPISTKYITDPLCVGLYQKFINKRVKNG